MCAYKETSLYKMVPWHYEESFTFEENLAYPEL